VAKIYWPEFVFTIANFLLIIFLLVCNFVPLETCLILNRPNEHYHIY